MPAKPPRIPNDLQDWITARKRHGLSHAHVQMARELGMVAVQYVDAEQAVPEILAAVAAS